MFSRNLIQLHVPAGATPKDGLSAGITMATALYSLATGRVVSADIAMTGELTLTDLVMPIGGLKEKILAARRAGIKKVILPEENRSDCEELPSHILKGIQLHFVSEFGQVIHLCFT